MLIRETYSAAPAYKICNNLWLCECVNVDKGHEQNYSSFHDFIKCRYNEASPR